MKSKVENTSTIAPFSRYNYFHRTHGCKHYPKYRWKFTHAASWKCVDVHSINDQRRLHWSVSERYAKWVFATDTTVAVQRSQHVRRRFGRWSLSSQFRVLSSVARRSWGVVSMKHGAESGDQYMTIVTGESFFPRLSLVRVHPCDLMFLTSRRWDCVKRKVMFFFYLRYFTESMSKSYIYWRKH